MKTTYLFIVCVLYFFNKIVAQDTIRLVEDFIIIAKVNEVESNVIKYSLWDNPDGTEYTIDKIKIKSIKLHNGIFSDFKSTSVITQSIKMDTNVHFNKISLLDVRKSSYRNLSFLVDKNPYQHKRLELMTNVKGIRKLKIIGNLTRIVGIYSLAVGHVTGIILAATADLGQKETIATVSINLLGAVCLTTAFISMRNLNKQRVKFVDFYNQ